MSSGKYEGYSLREIMLEGLGDAAKAHMLKLWNVALAAAPGARETTIAAAREGLRKTKAAYEGGKKLIDEELG